MEEHMIRAYDMVEDRPNVIVGESFPEDWHISKVWRKNKA